VVTLVRDGGNLVAQPEREQHLGGGRDEGHDAHEEQDMSDWREEGDAIARDFEFKDFAGAMAFVNQVAEMAEGANHHPDILIHGWNKVRLTLSTHTEGRVTQADHDLAAGIDGLGVG
jgi:4a-hydroxytetrahydrobiopterin dehydratase